MNVNEYGANSVVLAGVLMPVSPAMSQTLNVDDVGHGDDGVNVTCWELTTVVPGTVGAAIVVPARTTNVLAVTLVAETASLKLMTTGRSRATPLAPATGSLATTASEGMAKVRRRPLVALDSKDTKRPLAKPTGQTCAGGDAPTG